MSVEPFDRKFGACWALWLSIVCPLGPLASHWVPVGWPLGDRWAHWLPIGFRLWQSLGQGFVRDYFLPLPTPDLSGFREAPASYSDSLRMTRIVLRELHLPIPAQGQGSAVIWTFGDLPLLPPEAALFWSEHGDRALLATWAATFSYSRDVRDRLGRWSVTGSEEYVRDSRTIVLKTQTELAAKVRNAKGLYDACGERELLGKFKEHLLARSWSSERADAAAAQLQYFGPEELGKESIVQDTPRRSPSPAPSSAFSEGPFDLPRNEDYEFCIYITRRSGIRRLHRKGGCGRRPGVDFLNFELVSGSLDPKAYSAVCRSCWPQKPSAKKLSRSSKGGLNGSSEESSSSSSSSSSPSI